jgi:hypothetical protein
MKNALKRLVSGLLCLTMMLCLLPALGTPASAETGYDRGYDGGMAGKGTVYAHGLDVSAWQESGLNFRNFANAGYDYVILRCGTSYGKDVCFEEYYASAKAAGLDVGCYYYSYAKSVDVARAEAKEMIAWMGDKLFEYPIYFDYEDPSQASISGSAAAQICYAFMDTLKEAGYLVGLYSMASWIEQSWVTTSGIRDTYEGWVAHLATEANNSGMHSGEYKKLHSKYSTRYGMLQYSFTTYVNGAGPFDCNVSYKDYPAIVKQYGFNGYAEDETWVEKACFDPMVYRDRYEDLKGLSDEQLKNHWLKNGIKEGRSASAIFDVAYYLDNNADLKQAFGNDFVAAYNHFITKGYKEHRKFSRVVDGHYYCEKYSDVANSYKELFLLHYVDHGMNEGRRASKEFDPEYYWFIRPDVAQAWPGDYEMAARHYAGHGIREGIVAYDNQNPVISNAVISNITADGYTVTCTVKDNWVISKVAFPTWTLLNDQDDLAEDFMNTQKGTKDGDTYTFTVKASDHNNENGMYVTHIYATDRGGNTVSMQLEVVEVKEPQIVLKSSSEYVSDGAFVRGVRQSTSVNDILVEFDNETLEVLHVDGYAISGVALIGTGTQVRLYQNGVVVDSLTIVITGDIDGNSIVDTTDYMRVKAAVLGRFTLTDAQRAAADVDGSGTVGSTDYQKIREYFLGDFNMDS